MRCCVVDAVTGRPVTSRWAITRSVAGQPVRSPRGGRLRNRYGVQKGDRVEIFSAIDLTCSVVWAAVSTVHRHCVQGWDRRRVRCHRSHFANNVLRPTLAPCARRTPISARERRGRRRSRRREGMHRPRRFPHNDRRDDPAILFTADQRTPRALSSPSWAGRLRASHFAMRVKAPRRALQAHRRFVSAAQNHLMTSPRFPCRAVDENPRFGERHAAVLREGLRRDDCCASRNASGSRRGPGRGLGMRVIDQPSFRNTTRRHPHVSLVWADEPCVAGQDPRRFRRWQQHGQRYGSSEPSPQCVQPRERSDAESAGDQSHVWIQIWTSTRPVPDGGAGRVTCAAVQHVGYWNDPSDRKTLKAEGGGNR